MAYPLLILVELLTRAHQVAMLERSILVAHPRGYELQNPDRTDALLGSAELEFPSQLSTRGRLLRSLLEVLAEVRWVLQVL